MNNIKNHNIDVSIKVYDLTQDELKEFIDYLVPGTILHYTYLNSSYIGKVITVNKNDLSAKIKDTEKDGKKINKIFYIDRSVGIRIKKIIHPVYNPEYFL